MENSLSRHLKLLLELGLNIEKVNKAVIEIEQIKRNISDSKFNGGGGVSITNQSTGGGGTPASPDTSIQRNDGGVFAGDAKLTWNDTFNAIHAYKDVKWSDGGSGSTVVILAQNDDAFDSTGNPAALMFNAGTFSFADPVTPTTLFNLTLNTLTAASVITDTLGIKSLGVSSDGGSNGSFQVLLNGALSINQLNNGHPNIRVGTWAWTQAFFTTTAEAVFEDADPYVNTGTPVRLANGTSTVYRSYFGSAITFTRLGFTLIGAAPSTGAVTWEIWNGSAWTSTGITDTTNGMRQDGTLTLPAMTSKNVNGKFMYWVRFTVTSAYSATPNGSLQILGTVGSNPTYYEGNVGFLIKSTNSGYASSGLTVPTNGVMAGMIAHKQFIGDLVHYGIDGDTGGAKFKVDYQGKVSAKGGVANRVTTITTGATPTFNTDLCDFLDITALDTAVTSMTSGMTGTPTRGQKLTICFKDDGTPRAITWGAGFAPRGNPLPTTTTANKMTYVALVFDTVWGCVSAPQEA